MQMLRNRLGAMVMAACLLVALTFGAGVALAAGVNTLTVTGDSNSTLASDLKTGAVSLKVDVYRIADATYNEASDSYTYSLNGPFLNHGDDIAAQMEKEDWAKAAEIAADVVKKYRSEALPFKSPTQTMGSSASVTVSGLDDGVYLVLSHGASVTNGELKAETKTRQYKFLPSLIGLPTKEDLNSAEGEWLHDGSIAIKPQVTTKPPTTSSSVPPKRPPVRTGDDTNIVPFVVAMVVSGSLLVALAVYSRRSRNREDR